MYRDGYFFGRVYKRFTFESFEDSINFNEDVDELVNEGFVKAKGGFMFSNKPGNIEKC